MEKHLKLLGYKVKDVVTGFEGVVEHIGFDLYGCIQATVRPSGIKKETQEPLDSRWFDIKRLKITNKHRVMNVPDFTLPENGAADKPLK